jgi:hypothetical protein
MSLRSFDASGESGGVPPVDDRRIRPTRPPQAWDGTQRREPREVREPHSPAEWMTTLWRALVQVRPRLFDPLRPAPLAINFHRELHDVAKSRLSGRRIRKFLAVWTGRTAYLRALAKPGSVRYGLRGPAGPVAPEHRDHARQRLEARQRLARAAKPARRRDEASAGRR